MPIVPASLGQCRRFLSARSAAFGFQLFNALNVAKNPNVLEDAILVDLYFLGAKIGDRVMVLVANHHIEEHFARGGVNDRAVRLNRRRGVGLGEQGRESNQGVQGNHEKNTCRHGPHLTNPAIRPQLAGFPTILARSRPTVYPRCPKYARFP